MKEIIYLAREERKGEDDLLVILRNDPHVWSDGSIGCDSDIDAFVGDSYAEEYCDNVFPEAKVGKIYKYRLVEVLDADNFKVDKEGNYIK